MFILNLILFINSNLIYRKLIFDVIFFNFNMLDL